MFLHSKIRSFPRTKRDIFGERISFDLSAMLSQLDCSDVFMTFTRDCTHAQSVRWLCGQVGSRASRLMLSVIEFFSMRRII